MDDVHGARLDQHRAAQPIDLPAHDDDGPRIPAAPKKRDGVRRVVGRLQVVVEKDQLGLALDDAIQCGAERACAAHLDGIAEHDVERGAQPVRVEILVLDDEHVRELPAILLGLRRIAFAREEGATTPLQVLNHRPKISSDMPARSVRPQASLTLQAD